MIEVPETPRTYQTTELRQPALVRHPLRPLSRLIVFVWFVLLEYVRSGRIWVEVGGAIAFYVIFLRGDIDASKFFSLIGIFSVILTIYTASSVMGLGDRPPGYIILVRRVGRGGYLLGLFCASIVIVTLIYILLSLITILLSNVVGLDLTQWLLGTLPLLLNVGLLTALLQMLSPLVFSAFWRLFVLGMIALAFTESFWGRAQIDALSPTVRNLLRGLETILSYPLAPALSGYALSLSRDYGGFVPLLTLASQTLLLLLLLLLSVYSFSQRELLLSPE